ncbi:MAG: hypothetical protein KDD51_05170 [Bdellovibrionales bacterium]|nr:hypothetical protein [Bdellovibrionales bacterium]
MSRAIFFAIGAGLFLAGCASKTTTESARASIEERYKGKVGTARKGDFVEDFGPADWCKQEPGGGETCRFLRQTGTAWKGSTRYQKSYATFDEVVANFAPDGTLRRYEVKAQR